VQKNLPFPLPFQWNGLAIFGVQKGNIKSSLEKGNKLLSPGLKSRETSANNVTAGMETIQVRRIGFQSILQLFTCVFPVMAFEFHEYL